MISLKEHRELEAEDWADATAVQVAPLTTNVSKLFPSEALVTVRGKPRRAMADQIATAGKKRLGDRLGSIDEEDMASVEHAIRIQLGPTTA